MRSGIAVQFLRFSVVGILGNFLGYGLYLYLTSVQLDPKAAALIAFVTVLLFSFALNKRWTFGLHQFQASYLTRFGLAYGVALVANIAGLYVLVDLLGFDHRLVQAALIVLIAIALFYLQKRWVFASRQEATIDAR